MRLIRMIQWALRIGTLPAPEVYPDDDPDPSHVHVYQIPTKDGGTREYRQGKVIPESVNRLRPPTLYEAWKGISNT